MKVLITGGHVTPALALIDELVKDPKNQIIFVGRKYALDFDKTLSLEYKEIQKRQIEFVHLKTGRFTRTVSLKSFLNLGRVIFGFYNARRILSQKKPDVVISFGGYLALPIALWSKTLKIPIFIHEQAVNPGITNKIIAKFARKIFISFEETLKYFPREKTIITGNLVRPSIFKITKEPFRIGKDKPVIYVTGGSLGSHSINAHIGKLLPDLLKKYSLIHQTGDTKEYNDFSKLNELKKNLSPELSTSYYPAKHFFEDEIGYIYSVSDLVISRAGANTFFELLALEKPAILIPLPWSANKEQQKHAQIFKENGVAETFNQSRESKELEALIDSMIQSLPKYKENFKKLKFLYKEDAVKTIIEEIFSNQS